MTRPSRSVLPYALVAGIALTISAAQAMAQTDAKTESWPRFRGAANTDRSPDTGLLKKWPEDGPKRVWLFKKAGSGYSGFSIQGGRLYTMGTRDESTIMLCLDVASGEELWASKVGSILSNGWGDGPRSTPTVAGDRIYTVSGRGDILCVSAKDGKKLWSNRMRKFRGRVPQWGFSESLLVDGDQVICTPGGRKGAVVALKADSGEKIWQCEEFMGQPDYSSTVVAEIHGKKQYVRLLQNKLGGLDPKTGKLLWSVDWVGRTAVCPTPIVEGNQIYVTSGYRAGCMLVEVSEDWKAKILWQNKVMANHHGGVVKVGDHLFGHADTGWVCQNWKSGEQVWRERGLRKGAIHYADGMLYCLEEGSGTLALVEASTKEYSEVSRFRLEPQSEIRSRRGKIWVHPVVVGGRLFLRDQEYIYCYDVRSGQ